LTEILKYIDILNNIKIIIKILLILDFGFRVPFVFHLQQQKCCKMGIIFYITEIFNDAIIVNGL